MPQLTLFIPNFKIRHAGPSIQLLFINLAFLAEMYWPEQDTAKIGAFAPRRKSPAFGK